MMDIRRPEGADPGALVAVDATSGAGGLRVDPAQFDAYYFAPQKCFASDGGLWVALLSPGRGRAGRPASPAAGRWVPASLDLGIALDNSRLDQTYNTPALATLWLLRRPGGVDAGPTAASSGAPAGASGRPRSSTAGPSRRSYATPFVAKPDERSNVVGTIDLDDADRGRDRVRRCCGPTGSSTPSRTASWAATSCGSGCSPPSSPADVEALTRCIDYVVERLALSAGPLRPTGGRRQPTRASTSTPSGGPS